MTPSAQKRMWIVAVLLVVFGGICLAAPVPAQFRPPMPPVNPPPPFPPGGGNPNPPGMPFPPGGNPNLPGNPFPPGGNPNGPNNPLQPGLPNGPVMVWRCSKCNAEAGRGDFPPEKCPVCGVQFINGVKPLFGNPPTAPPVGGNPPGFNPNPNPMQPPGGVFQPQNPPLVSSPAPAPSSSSNSSSGSSFFLVVLIIIVAAAIGFVLLGIAGVIFWVRFINQAVEASSTPTARFRPRRRRGKDYSL
jgi:hypothetical protein